MCEEKDAASLEPGFEATNYDTEDSHILPALDKFKALRIQLENEAIKKNISYAYNHNCAPEDNNYNRKAARSNLASENSRRWLEKSIWEKSTRMTID